MCGLQQDIVDATWDDLWLLQGMFFRVLSGWAGIVKK